MKRLFGFASTMTLLICAVTCITLLLAAPTIEAEAATESGFQYFDANGDEQTTDELDKAISGAMKGTRVVKLLGDTEWEAAGSSEQIVLVTGAVEIDLCGHTLTVYQGGLNNPGRRRITVSGGATLTVKNGTLCVRRVDPGNEQSSYPLFYFRDSKSGGVLNLENVNTYSGTLIYANNSTDATVNVTGGVHYVTLDYDSALTKGGFVNSCTAMTFTATNATFFADKSSYVVSSTSTAAQSTFTFTGCKLVSDPGDSDGTYTLVKNVNAPTALYFNDCDIYGSIYADNVVLGSGTRISDAMTITDYTVEGGTLNASPSVETFVFNDCDDDVSDGFSFSKINVTCAFTHEVGEAVSLCTVAWYDENGALITTEKVTRGATATPPEHKIPENVNNGWVKIEFDGGWSNSLYGEAVDLTVTEDVAFYPSVSLCIAYLSASRFNLSLFGNVSVNVYLPLEEAPDAIELVEVTDGAGVPVLKNEQAITDSGIVYAWYPIGSVGVMELGNDIELNVRFTYNGTEFLQTLLISPAKYAETVLSSATYYSDAKQMIADMIVYSNSIWQYVNATDENAPALDGLIAEYSELATPADRVTSESFTQGAAGDYGALYPYVSSITFDVAAYEPCYRLQLDSSARVKSVSFVTFGGAVYTMNEKNAEYDSNGYLTVARSIGMSLYYIDSEIEIILTVDDNGTEREVRGSYTLNDYYNGVYPTLHTQSPESAARLDSLMRALRAYARSALAYKNR